MPRLEVVVQVVILVTCVCSGVPIRGYKSKTTTKEKKRKGNFLVLENGKQATEFCWLGGLCGG